jgi:TPR repeat protein
MLVFAALILAVAPPLRETPDAAISPEVVALARKHGVNLPSDALAALERLDSAGDKSATALLGEYHMYRGQAPGSDWTRACDYSERAGAYSSALHNLANCHFYGNGRPKDLPRARILYRQAMDLGMAKSACALGNMLIAGLGGGKDVEAGLDLCRRGADAGDSDAQTDYGGYLLTGEHKAKDSVLARRYLQAAAEKRQRNAAFLLGQIYWNGDGGARNRTEAARWLRVAHDAGRPDAAFLIGIEGLGRIVDASRAKRPIEVAVLQETERWFRIAEETDPDPAKRSKASEMLRVLAAIQRGD